MSRVFSHARLRERLGVMVYGPTIYVVGKKRDLIRTEF